jgi:uncharacterized membrane protein (UPF0127 family)
MGSTGGSVAALVLLAAGALAACRNEEPRVHVFTRSGAETALRVRVADGADERQAALDEPIAGDASVLFRFSTEDRHALPENASGAPVDVLYASPLATIVEVHPDVAAGEAPPPARAPWLSALVVAGGFVERSGVMIGDKFDPRHVPARAAP